jgi:transposase InsO family protein
MSLLEAVANDDDELKVSGDFDLEVHSIELEDEFKSRLIRDSATSPLASLPDFTLKDGIIYHKDRIVLPTEELQLETLKRRHDSPLAGHPGVHKTIELISRDFHWKGLDQMVRRYIRGCDTCARAKPSRHAPYGLLQPLPVPSGRWEDISVDFITDLPTSNNFDAIAVFKCRLTKRAHFLACTKEITSKETADLFLREVFRLHGIPRTITSDRGPQFVARFWKFFLEQFGCTRQLSSGHHPETNGSAEIVNPAIELYLRIYSNYSQDDWTTWLPLAEFTYNNTIISTSSHTPFFADQGYHPNFDPTTLVTGNNTAPESHARLVSNILTELRAALSRSQERYSQSANTHRIDLSLMVGDLVFVDARHIKTTRPSKKLDYKKLGPYPIVEKINSVAYRLKLPSSMRIHPVFHVSLLEPKSKVRFACQDFTEPPPISVQGELEYEVSKVIASRKRRGRLQYLVEWTGYSTAERTWEPLENVSNALDLLLEFHNANPRAIGITEVKALQALEGGADVTECDSAEAAIT